MKRAEIRKRLITKLGYFELFKGENDKGDFTPEELDHLYKLKTYELQEQTEQNTKTMKNIMIFFLIVFIVSVIVSVGMTIYSVSKMAPFVP